MGSGEIGQNVEGVDVEQALGKTVVPSLHGSYSLGIAVGGLGGLAATTGDISVVAHLAAVAVVTAAASSWLVANLDPAVGQEPGSSYARASVRGSVTAFLSVWTERRTLAIGVIVLGMALAEGSANDWLPLIMVDGFSLSAATASLVYAFFGLSMAIGRFSGGYFLDRFGRAPVMVASAVLAVLGIATVSFAPTATLAAAAPLLGNRRLARIPGGTVRRR